MSNHLRLDLILGDCVERMRKIPTGSIYRITCDPPYFLSFMSKAWDSAGEDARVPKCLAAYQSHLAWLAEAYRILVPGGLVQAFSGTRTHHRLAAAMEDTGFEIIGLQGWIYASGFPKSLSVSKAIDKRLGKVREPKRIPHSGEAMMRHGGENTRPWIEEALKVGYHEAPGDEPASEEAARWVGWGTALKPAWEPIIVGRKPV